MLEGFEFFPRGFTMSYFVEDDTKTRFVLYDDLVSICMLRRTDTTFRLVFELRGLVDLLVDSQDNTRLVATHKEILAKYLEYMRTPQQAALQLLAQSHAALAGYAARFLDEVELVPGIPGGESEAAVERCKKEQEERGKRTRSKKMSTMDALKFYSNGFEWSFPVPPRDSQDAVTTEIILYEHISAVRAMSGAVDIGLKKNNSISIPCFSDEDAERVAEGVLKHLRTWLDRDAIARKEEREFRAALLALLGKVTERLDFDPDVGEEAIEAVDRCKKRAREEEGEEN